MAEIKEATEESDEDNFFKTTKKERRKIIVDEEEESDSDYCYPCCKIMYPFFFKRLHVDLHIKFEGSRGAKH